MIKWVKFEICDRETPEFKIEEEILLDQTNDEKWRAIGDTDAGIFAGIGNSIQEAVADYLKQRVEGGQRREPSRAT